MCKKFDDIIPCAGSGHHLRPDRIEPGAPYFGKSLPVRPQPSQQLHIWKSSTPLYINWTMRSFQLDISSRMVGHPTSHASMGEIQSFFGDQVISKGLWPPRSPDMTPPDYFSWGYLKGRVYQNKPRTIDALKANITEENQAVTA